MANLKNLNTSDITLFPISTPYKPGGRTLSEQNLINIFRSYLDTDSFISSTEIDTSKPFEFVIHGYYCAINLTEEVLSIITPTQELNVYAFITLMKISEDNNYKIINCRDTEPNQIFKGLHIVFDTSYSKALEQIKSEFPTTDVKDIYGLHILSYRNSNLNIPSESLIKIKSHSLDLNEIDGGEI